MPFEARASPANRSFSLPHRADRRPIPIWKRGALAAVLLSFALPAARAQDNSKPDDQYKYTPDKPQAPARQPPPSQPNQYPEYRAPQYPQYREPQYPQYKPQQYPQYKPPAGRYPQYPLYPQYPGRKGPPGQYRGSQQDQQACINDVFRLCSQFIPDATRIVSCLQSNRKNLSPACRAVFARGRKGR